MFSRIFLTFLIVFSITACETGHVETPKKPSRKIALTLDDPPLPKTQLFTSAQHRARSIIEQIQKVNGPVSAFFTVGLHIEKFGTSDLKSYAEAGHIIGNHTYTHPALSKISVDEFIADVQKNHNLIQDLPGFGPYFRYPYLDMGGREKQNVSLAKLAEMGYTNAYVTLSNHDWYINSILLSAQRSGKTINYEAFGDAYVAMMIDCANYIANQYDVSGVEQPAHVLLLHANDINALYLGKLITAFRDSGWEVIDVDHAYTLNEAKPPKKSDLQKLAALQGKSMTPLMNLKHLAKLFDSEEIFPKATHSVEEEK